MKLKQYIPLALAGICIAGPSFAIEKEGPVCSSVLCAMSNKGGFYVGATGYYAKPSETGIGFVTDSWQFSVPGGVDAVSKPFDPDFDWAWGIQLGYDFPDSANNIEVNYLNFDEKYHAVNSFANGAISFGSILFPDVTLTQGAFPTLVSDAYLKYEVEQADVKVGRKYTDMSGRFNIRPSLGVRYAEIEHKLTFAAPGNMVSEFEGAGPMFSIDTNYLFGNGFALVGYVDYALIVGDIKSHSFVFLGQNFGYKWPERQRIVNNMTGRIALNYTYAFSNTSTVALEGGYQVNEYIDSMDTIRGWIANQHIAGNETNSFGMQGPYFKLSYHA